MDVQIKNIPLSKIEVNKGQIKGVPANPRIIKDGKYKALVKSIKDDPEMMNLRELLVYEQGGKFILIGGNMRYRALRELKYKDAPCKVIPAGTSVEKLKAYLIKDNNGFGEWDWDLLANEWDAELLQDWGVDMPFSLDENTELEESEIERKEREFREKMEAGEISEEDEEYQEFLEKFKLKKTTDDCYTPPIVFDAIADWVVKEYNVDKAKFVRPFYPGGDYQNENYKADDIVVDNPPFSILAEIIRFYQQRKIKFFLYGPHLTLFSSSSSCTSIPVGAPIVYENGANVNTSFVTNLDDPKIRFKTSPSLYAVIKEANERNLAQTKRELPKYSYDRHIITTPFLSQLSRLGIEFSVPVAESESIAQLDCQKESKKAIFGKGYIVSHRVFKEREKAEREKAEKWELSKREWAIVEKLNKQGEYNNGSK